ncbi:MAG: hypothetical protein LC797_00695 [Chloroflexi bacterium]|nr:hypothetical protein [Chloroflexota bacterium]
MTLHHPAHIAGLVIAQDYWVRRGPAARGAKCGVVADGLVAGRVVDGGVLAGGVVDGNVLAGGVADARALDGSVVGRGVVAGGALPGAVVYGWLPEQHLDFLQGGHQLGLGGIGQGAEQRADLCAGALLEWLEHGAAGRRQTQPGLAAIPRGRSSVEQTAPIEAVQDAAEVAGIQLELAP